MSKLAASHLVNREGGDYLHREINTSHSTGQNVLLIAGARQVGKTTLIQTCLRGHSDAVQFNLEKDLSLRAEIDQTGSFEEFLTVLRAAGFDPKRHGVLFMDEAQESARLGSYVRFLKEDLPRVRTILSGSSLRRLFREEERIPVGRVQYLTVTPFSFYEFLEAVGQTGLRDQIDGFDPGKAISPLMHEKLLAQVDAYLQTGGLPEVVRLFADGGSFAEHRRSLLLAQEDDFARKELFKNRHLFMTAMRAVANNIGFPAKFTQVSGNTYEAKQIIAVLKAWQLIIEVEQRGLAVTSEFLPKRYGYDVGMVQLLRSLPFPHLSVLKTANSALRTQLGGLFENAVLLQLMTYKMGQIDVCGWRSSSKDQIEVDFIWQRPEPLPLECKAALKTSRRSFVNLHRYLGLSGARVGFLISAAPFEVRREEKRVLVNLPFYLCRPAVIERLSAEL